MNITVYNVFGEEVTRLVGGERPAGYHEVTWNGRNFGGNQVSSGIYFYRVTAGAFTDIRKMVLLK